MIVKIQPPNPNIDAAVKYNERKMDGAAGIRPPGDTELKGIENGHVLATRNVPEGSTLTEAFDERRMLSLKNHRAGRKMENPTFHMSVNPSETDKELDEATTVKMIDEMMDGLGYAKQPYRIYKHTDISRTHYHVVSCRIGEDGKKISDSFERLVLREKLKEMSKQYGFTILLSEKEKEKEAKKNGKKEDDGIKAEIASVLPARKNQRKDEKDKEKDDKKETVDGKKKAVPAYDRKAGKGLIAQIRDITEEVLEKWHFSTFEQVQALLLRRYKVFMEIENGKGGEDRAVYCGTNAEGQTITPFISDADLGTRYLERLMQKATKEKMRNRREQRQRLMEIVIGAANRAKNFDEFKSLMERKGVIMVLSFTEGGNVFGVTYLDKATKCAWKGSETMLTVKWLTETAEKKGWVLTKDKYQRRIEHRATIPSRRPAPKTTEEPPLLYEDAPVKKTGKRHGKETPQITNYLPGHHEASRESEARHDSDWLRDENENRKPGGIGL